MYEAKEAAQADATRVRLKIRKEDMDIDMEGMLDKQEEPIYEEKLIRDHSVQPGTIQRIPFAVFVPPKMSYDDIEAEIKRVHGASVDYTLRGPKPQMVEGQRMLRYWGFVIKDAYDQGVRRRSYSDSSS